MKISIQLAVWTALFLGTNVSSFSTPKINSARTMGTKEASLYNDALFMSPNRATGTETSSTNNKNAAAADDPTDKLYIPVSFDEMVRQSSSAMKDAYENGVTRQMVRILLPRSPESDQLGQLIENDAEWDMRSAILVPPDETWQGGIMQLYRAASIAARGMLREYSKNVGGGVPPRLEEDRSVDESGVDGIGLWLTQGASAQDDVSCFVQPSQETIDAIESISNQAGGRLVALLNPQWRIIDDALDTASRGEGLFGNMASFLGGKGGSLRRLN
jgi:hypothetical protein